MPRTIAPTQPVRPTTAPARVAKPQVRPVGFKPTAPPPARRINTQVRAANFTPATSPRMTMSQAASQVSVNAGTISSASVTPTNNCCCTACTGLQCLDRTRFFSGQLLTDADLNNEQSYMLAKNRLHNRYLNGWGVVCGMQVTCSECDGWVNISPGYAIDPCGNDIIVCSAQSFNVLQAIQACCTPQSQTPNCSPLRYTPPATCQDQPQQWCITIQYQEQQTNMVTPLQPVSSTTCGCGSNTNSSSCGCGGSSGGSSGGCGCGGNGSSAGTSTSSSTSSSSTSSTAACQATRILEGFQFGLSSCSSTEPVGATSTESTGAQPGTITYQVQQCAKTLVQLVQQAPRNLETLWNAGNQQGVYQEVCNYVVNVQQYFAQNPTLTDCSLLDLLNDISVPPITGNSTLATYQAIRNGVVRILVDAFLNCLCLSLIPQCPPAACDNRVPLACVTIQNGVIQEICHFNCRKQLIGVTALNYWFEPIFNAFSTVLSDLAARFCCGENEFSKDPYYFSSSTAFAGDNVTSNGFTNSAMFSRAASSFMAQKMGATMVNAANPNLRAVDMRPYINQPLQTVQLGLANQGWGSTKSPVVNSTQAETNASLFDIQPVDQDPSWSAAAIASAGQFAPSAVTAGQPLTLYVQGQSVVGIEVTSPTRALQLQINSLNSTISNLQTQLTTVQGQINQSPASPAAPSTPPAQSADDTSTKPGKKK